MSLKPVGLTIKPIYQGSASIATCHFQNLANILEVQGLKDARRRICLSWGFSWRGGGILYGGNRWNDICNETYGTKLSQMYFPTWEEAERFEEELLSAGIPFVAEVDAYMLPSPYQNNEHVVHTVTVLSKEHGSVTILDNTNNPVPVRYSNEDYQLMRSLPCEGRVEPYFLYVSLPFTPIDSGHDSVIKIFYQSLRNHWEQNLATLEAFTAWVEGSINPINVCRVAGEREYLQLLFEKLGENQPDLAHFANDFADLSDRWYLLHMITANENNVNRPQRPRIVRLLQELRCLENSLAEKVCSTLKLSTGIGTEMHHHE